MKLLKDNKLSQHGVGGSTKVDVLNAMNGSNMAEDTRRRSHRRVKETCELNAMSYMSSQRFTSMECIELPEGKA